MAIAIKCNVNKLPKPLEFSKPDFNRPVNVTVVKKKPRKPINKGINHGVYGRPRFYTPAQDAIITQMRNEGKSFKEIGDEFGKSADAIRRRWYLIRTTR